MEFIVNTDEYMHVDVSETTGMLPGTFQAAGTTATYSIYPDDVPLEDANAKVLNQPVNIIQDNTFKCRINPDATWIAGPYVLYLKITNIPTFAEKPRFGPFRFGVVQ